MALKFCPGGAECEKAMARYGMLSEEGEAAVDVVVARLAGAPLDELAEVVPEAVALIASMHPEVRQRRVVEAIADALVPS